ncbi:MAG: low specificity L-threonine aldolase [Lachnospiraceae bacterium]|nr:low specificity L-threonine aldolase [Lachnospiraceae bacterium]
MLSFVNDYSETACEEILRRLTALGSLKSPGYGEDAFCQSAKEKIREAVGCPDADIFFLVGGTQTNATVLDAILETFEGVIAADTGHINAHEAGAVELLGHKILTIPGKDGKLDPGAVRKWLEDFYAEPTHEHMVAPGAVYISQPTEYGTIYTKEELQSLRALTKEYGLRLYLDGARLGYALASPGNDVGFKDIGALTDAFYIGGTKQGALMGEAVVFPEKTPKHFFSIMKQHGALLAKGFLLGLQFDTLFTDDLYVKLSRRAVASAKRLREIFVSKGYRLAPETESNQSFVALTQEEAAALQENVEFGYWGPLDEKSSVYRFVCSVTTTPEEVEELAKYIPER